MQQAMVEGSVDSEKDEFNQLLLLVANGAMSESEALSRAQQISEKRQSYH